MVSTNASLRQFDAARLLQFAINSEMEYATLVSQQQGNHNVNNEVIAFGHPDPPSLYLFDLSVTENSPPALILVAYTMHTVSIQRIVQQRFGPAFEEEPLELCMLLPENDTSSEKITCLTVVSYNLEGTSSCKNTRQQQEQNQQRQQQRQLPKITVDDVNNSRMAVIFGTDDSHLYTVEIMLLASGLRCVTLTNTSNSNNNSTLFQIFPREDVVGQSSRWQRKRNNIHPKHVPFAPTHGVAHLNTYRFNNNNNINNKNEMMLWITYNDGTLIRLHSAACFPSLWQKAAGHHRSVEDYLGSDDSKTTSTTILVRCQVSLPKSSKAILVMPLPRHHPSPFSLLYQQPIQGDGKFYKERFDALVFAPGTTFCMYTSENDNFAVGDDQRERAKRNALSSTSGTDRYAVRSVSRTLMGSAIDVLRWGIGATSTHTEHTHDDGEEAKTFDENENDDNDDDDDDERDVDAGFPFFPFPSLYSQPLELFVQSEFHDVPREIELCTIDPNGELAAVTDNLGRVLLIELATRQVIRLWKGFRDVTCYWMQTTQNPESQCTKLILHLIIHSRQRRVVEVWRVRHGSRMASISVGRDAKILPSTTFSSSLSKSLATCYLVHSTVPGTLLNQVIFLDLDDLSNNNSIASKATDSITTSNSKKSSKVASPSRKGTLNLLHLQQLLSADDSDQYSKEDVHKALHEITSLSELATALDLLAVGSLLEKRLGVQGSSFHTEALIYCQKVLNAAMHQRKSRGDTVQTNPHVQVLSFKIEYHYQVRYTSYRQYIGNLSFL